jgi:hypothetical protein
MEEKLKDTTLLFLVRRDDSGAVSEICLAMKKRGFGTGKWKLPARQTGKIAFY